MDDLSSSDEENVTSTTNISYCEINSSGDVGISSVDSTKSDSVADSNDNDKVSNSDDSAKPDSKTEGSSHSVTK